MPFKKNYIVKLPVLTRLVYRQAFSDWLWRGFLFLTYILWPFDKKFTYFLISKYVLELVTIPYISSTDLFCKIPDLPENQCNHPKVPQLQKTNFNRDYRQSSACWYVLQSSSILTWFARKSMQSPQSATTLAKLTLIEPVDRVVHAGTFCNHHRHQYWPGLPHWQQKEGCRGLRQFSLKEFIINSLCLGRRPLFTWAERFTIVAIYYALHSVGLFWLLC